MDRAAEILFGLIMALTFTCSISIVTTHRTEIRQLLIGAISCNLAWGIVDATMYLIGVLAEKQRNKRIYDAIKRSAEPEVAARHLADALPPLVVAAIGLEGLEKLRTRLVDLPDTERKVRLTMPDFKKALAIFLLVFVSTFPVVIPFVLIRETNLALRLSNGVAIAMMFICGWSIARYVGFTKWKMSLTITVVGILLVAVTIALGG